jgi:competence transcription factor ComK
MGMCEVWIIVDKQKSFGRMLKEKITLSGCGDIVIKNLQNLMVNHFQNQFKKQVFLHIKFSRRVDMGMRRRVKRQIREYKF